ncbi:MAG: hypothetical protein O2955_15345 [Planctomycetota bacterium]|nr:hypothetical protein [Planctomycetota bacterium]MDA1213889.1 hypothetical protein [Planctomycetota bacterium]
MTEFLLDEHQTWLPASEQLPDIPGGWRQQEITIADKRLQLTLPAVPDAFLEDRRVLEENRRDDYMPYWAYLWPASLKMAAFIYHQELNRSDRRTPVLEFGCGVGLVGLGVLAAGGEAIFSDYRAEPVQVAMINARNNGFDACRGLVHDWRDPSPLHCERIVACEVLYEQRHHQPIVDFLIQILTDTGVCWIGDPGREKSRSFVALATEKGLNVDVLNEKGERQTEFGHGAFQILQIGKRRPA